MCHWVLVISGHQQNSRFFTQPQFVILAQSFKTVYPVFSNFNNLSVCSTQRQSSSGNSLTILPQDFLCTKTFWSCVFLLYVDEHCDFLGYLCTLFIQNTQNDSQTSSEMRIAVFYSGTMWHNSVLQWHEKQSGRSWILKKSFRSWVIQLR